MEKIWFLGWWTTTNTKYQQWQRVAKPIQQSIMVGSDLVVTEFEIKKECFNQQQASVCIVAAGLIRDRQQAIVCIVAAGLIRNPRLFSSSPRSRTTGVLVFWQKYSNRECRKNGQEGFMNQEALNLVTFSR
jgi:hypothetical protein